MCRFFIYVGLLCNIKKLIWLPEHSQIKQSFTRAWVEEGGEHNPRDQDINVDGFGICSYDDEFYSGEFKKPLIYKCIKSMWGDKNFLELSDRLKTRLLFRIHK